MISHRLPFRFLLLCLAAVFAAGCQRTLIQLSTPTPAQASDREAVIQQINGTVESRAGADAPWAAAAPNARLAVNSQVRTGANSSALLQLTEGSKIHVGANTALTFKILNPYQDSLLTALYLEQGQVWVLLTDGALDVETSLGTASARTAYLSVDLKSPAASLSVTCLQGICSFENRFIPSGYKMAVTKSSVGNPEAMSAADFGQWGLNVPEATQLAWLATEAVVQGSATLPIVPTPTPTLTLTPAPDQLTATPPSPAATTPAASAVTPVDQPTVTPIPFTPIPPAPIIGQHTVKEGETLFCIARVYGVLPAAIAQTNNLTAPFNVRAGQTLKIPDVPWNNVPAGPVCAPQFTSPNPGLPYATATPEATPTPAIRLVISPQCIENCNSREGEYVLQIDSQASGGVPPYNYDPGERFWIKVKHCQNWQGTVTVTAANGQKASGDWRYIDTGCPATP